MTIAIAVRTHNMSSHRTETTSAPVAFVVWQIATTLRVHTGLQGGKPHCGSNCTSHVTRQSFINKTEGITVINAPLINAALLMQKGLHDNSPSQAFIRDPEMV